MLNVKIRKSRNTLSTTYHIVVQQLLSFCAFHNQSLKSTLVFHVPTLFYGNFTARTVQDKQERELFSADTLYTTKNTSEASS